ncbi:hypothetical protein [Leptolyngbya ohadii]|uniref:hypothetical protein n=1 Tax=Leptolyngbya ohadii TaxID=1962290 RepID=UPI000B59A002|nr:hypothetical protein [Leptolyngbya ohadii]
MKPVTYYVQIPQIDSLVNRYGAEFQRVSREEKTVLLLLISSKLATGESLESILDRTRSPQVSYDTIEDFTLRLDRASDDELMGICEALITQLRYGR